MFKPRDEEPYADHNPKSMKKLQKLCCPCCFGRAGIMRNWGYMSEVGASLVDEILDLKLVPTTRVIIAVQYTANILYRWGATWGQCAPPHYSLKPIF